jgi:choline-phosphate cytidylyltransferase/glycerol-3-phosphate cytidylyltransferase
VSKARCKLEGLKVSIIGYTTGVFDLFHVGHVNILRSAKSMCDHLVVGVSTDELVSSYKGNSPIIPFLERCEVVRHCEYVDTVIAQANMDKKAAVQKIGAKILFVGDDWYGTEKWKKIDSDLNAIGVQVVYFPYTQGTSSTNIKRILESFYFDE